MPVPDTNSQYRMEEQTFPCHFTYHLVKEGLAGVIYSFALREAEPFGGLFCQPTSRLAEYFKCSDRTIRRAYQTLVRLGFFELHTPVRGSNLYRVLSHEEWLAKHPGQCSKPTI